MFHAVSYKRFRKGFIISLLFSMLLVYPVYASKGTVVGKDVNVRTSNSTDSDVHTKLNTGDVVDVVELVGDFHQINYNGGQYYIHKDFVAMGTTLGNVNGTSVNIRKYPSTNHDVLSEANIGDSFEILGKYDEWIQILFEGGGAFIHRDYIDIPEGLVVNEVEVDIPPDEVSLGLVNSVSDSFYAMVTSTAGLNLREEPSLDASVIGTYAHGATLDFIITIGEWTKVSLDGNVGYMSNEFLSIKQGKRPENSRSQRIIDFARQYLGTPYVWGGTSLQNGVDCSGFVYSVMKNFGITLNRGSMYQYGNGYSVKKAELVQGDLVFFDTDRNGGISHVGIYMGGGQFIHSSSSKRTWGVTVSSLYEQYYINTYYGACRIL